MTKLTATTTTTDEARGYRCMIAWLDGDKYAIDQVLAEVMADPVGTPGLLFFLIDLAAQEAIALDPNARDGLRSCLLQLEQDET